MSHLSSENLEIFINDVLKRDLKQLEQHIEKYNAEIMEYNQLGNTLRTFKGNVDEKFKTRMNIGANIFMEAQVNDGKTILVDIGKGCYLEMLMEEALKFCEFKTKVLTKECDVLRQESIQKRTEIKLAVMCIAEQEKLHEKSPNDK